MSDCKSRLVDNRSSVLKMDLIVGDRTGGRDYYIDFTIFSPTGSLARQAPSQTAGGFCAHKYREKVNTYQSAVVAHSN